MQTHTPVPLLDHDFDDGRSAMSRVLETYDQTPFPERFLLSFMGDALEEYVDRNGCEEIANFHSEVRDFAIFRGTEEGRDFGLVQAPVGAPAAAMMMDLLIASGARAIIACGGCGVTERLPVGSLLVPTAALRDEGTSYHYASPSPEIELDGEATGALLQTARELGLRCSECRVWTTDGFFRETPSLIRKRKEQGYAAVDMECSALAAVARFYGATFGELLYSGDSLADPERHDERGWLANMGARQATISVAARALCRL